MAASALLLSSERAETMRPAPYPGQRASPRESTDISGTICDSHLPNCQQAVYNLL